MITTSSIPTLLTFRKGAAQTKQRRNGKSAYNDWIRLGGLEDEKAPPKSRKKRKTDKYSSKSKSDHSKNKR